MRLVYLDRPGVYEVVAVDDGVAARPLRGKPEYKRYRWSPPSNDVAKERIVVHSNGTAMAVYCQLHERIEVYHAYPSQIPLYIEALDCEDYCLLSWASSRRPSVLAWLRGERDIPSVQVLREIPYRGAVIRRARMMKKEDVVRLVSLFI